MTVTIHATDLDIFGRGQATTTAVCGKRASVNRVLSIASFQGLQPATNRSYGKEVACVGCRALLAERNREADAAKRRAGVQ